MKKESPLPKNVFYDINKLPKEFGILVFPISIIRADHGKGQGAEQIMEYVKIFSPDKVSEPKIGLNIIYGDFLYFNSPEPAISLKNKFMGMVLGHKNQFQKLLTREWNRFQIQHAFSYEVWNQLYLNYRGDFKSDYERFRQASLKDQKFLKYLEEDAEYCGRELTDEQVSFFLEEHFMLYLLSKKQIVLPNEYVQDRERWVLWCYPGKVLKGQVYVYQKNP
ncbi:MAG: hypothetical protein AAB681_02690, partial [Patescibacteria group bacterium]